MNTNRTISERDDPAEIIIAAAGVHNVGSFKSRVSTDPALDEIRRITDCSNKAIARSGRFNHASWGITLVILGCSFIGAAWFLPTQDVELGVAAALCVAGGVVLIVRYDPNSAVRQVEAFDRLVVAGHQTWASVAEQHASAMAATLTEAIAGTPHRIMESGYGIREIISALHDTIAQARELQQALEHEAETGAQETAVASEVSSTKDADFRRHSARRIARFFAGGVRKRAAAALGARERLASLRRKEVSLRHVMSVANTVERALEETARTLEQSGLTPLVELADHANQEVDSKLQQGARGLFGKIVPPAQDVVEKARALFTPRIDEIARAVVARANNVSLADAIMIEVDAILARNPLSPPDLASYFAGLNGTAEAILAQFTNESEELAISQPIPGRTRRRIRAVLVKDGANSPLTRSIQQRSEGFVVRGIEVDNPQQLLQVTESRFEPGSELVELRDAAQVLNQLSDEAKAVMVTAVDDDALVLNQFRPEERENPRRGMRLLALGLATGVIVRRRATYELKQPNGLAVVIGKSFHATVEALQADTPNSKDVRQLIEAEMTARGSDGFCRAAHEAVQQPTLVPEEHLAEVQALLAEEIASLGQKR